MNPDEIAAAEEEKRNNANSANQATSLTPEQGGTQLSGTAAPAPVTPTASATAPTKTGATAQANIGGFQQANQAKIAALGNIANQRIQERVGAANQAIAGQKAARVDDVNAQTYAGPKNASLEEIGANEKLQGTLAGAGRKADITNASQQVAGFGAYNELKNLANNAGSKAYANNLGLTGGATDRLLARSNAQAQQGMRNQVRGVQDTLKTEQVGALSGIKAAGENVNKANEAAVNEINTNLTGQATAAETEGLQNLRNATSSAESQAVARANAQINQQRQSQIDQANALRQQYAGQDNLKAGGDYTRMVLDNLQQELANGPADVPGRLTTTADRAAHKAATQAKIDTVMQNINNSKLAEGKLQQSDRMLADANKLQNITSLSDANNRTLSPGEYAQLQASQQALSQAKGQLGNKATGLSSLSKEKQAGYQALQNILKDPSKLSTIDTGAGSYSEYQKLLNKIR